MTLFEQWQKITREELAALYERSTMTEIAAQFGITPGAVSHRLRTWGLSARLTGKKHSPGPKRGFNPPLKELERLYRKMSMREIARHYGVGETVVFTRIKEAGLATVSRSERLTGRPKTPEHAARLAEAMKGKWAGSNNPQWRGGVMPERIMARSNPQYRAWKEAVLLAADHRCARCGVENGSRCGCCDHVIRLHAHHIKSFADHEADRYDPANGEALCEKCHRAEHHEQTQ